MKRREDHAAQRLLEQMGRLVVPLVPPEQESRLHARTAASVDRMLDRLTAKSWLWRARVSGGAVAIAAVAVVSLAGAWLLRSEPLVATNSAHLIASTGAVALVKKPSTIPVAVGVGAALAVGDELSTATGAHANLSLADHAVVEVASETRLRVASLPPGSDSKSELIELVRGEISFQVPKLESGSTLSVRTPDTVVTVRGTRFSVAVEGGSGSSVVTRVSVMEGRVEVASRGRTLFLTRGARWSSVDAAQASRPAEAPTQAPAAETPDEAAPTAAASSVRRARSVETQAAKSLPSPAAVDESRVAALKAQQLPEPASTLAEENRLYKSALQLSKTGDSGRSLSTLESFMRQYPRSPLIQNAQVEHFRVLLQMGNVSGAAREARRYMSEYPSGFARAEAREIALRGLGGAN